MKKALFFAGLATASLLFAGCNKEADVKDLDGFPIEIILSDAQTRTTNAGMSTKWAEGDALSVFYAPAGETTYSVAKFDVTEPDNNVATGTVNLTAESNDWYLFYPYDSHLTTPANTGSGYMTVGGKTQTQKGNDNKEHLAGKNLPIVGVQKAVAASAKPNVPMHHVSSVVAVNVTNDTEEALTVQSVAFTAPEDIVGTYYINFAGEELAFKSSGATYVSATATLNVQNGTPIPKGESAKFFIAIKPFKAKVGDKLTLKITADAGIVEKDVELEAAADFKAGFIKTLNVNYKAAAPVQTITVSDIAASITTTSGDDAFSGKLEGAIVTFVSGSNAFIQDETGGILLYKYGHTFKAGDKLSGNVSGKGKVYSGLKELTELTVETVTSDQPIPAAKEMTLAELNAAYDANMSVLVKLKGVTVSGAFDNRNTTMTDGTETLALRDQKNGLTIGAGKYDIIGFPSYHDAAQFGVWAQENIIVAADAPVLAAALDGEASVSAATTSVKVNVTGNVAWYMEKEEGSEALSFNPESGEGIGAVTVSFPANTTSTAVTYEFYVKTNDATLAAAGKEEIKFTITQAAATPVTAKTLPYEEAFSNTKGDFTIEDKVIPDALSYVWLATEKYGMKASAFANKTAYASESWLISPVVSFVGATHPALTFSHAVNNFASVAKAQEETSVWIREKDGEWTKLSGVNYPTSLSWTFVESGSIDLSAYVNKQIEIGFKYTSTTDGAGTWEVKNFKLAEAAAGPVDPTLTVTPASVNVVAGNTVKLQVETNSDGAKSFVSSNTDVATVATDGTVTGVAAGTAKITVKVAATTSYTEKSVEVPVTVTAADPGLHQIVVSEFADVNFSTGEYVITTDQGSNTTNAPSYNTKDSDIRLYAGNTITVKNRAANVKKIVFNLSAQGMKRLAPITASVGTVTAQAANDTQVEWTGDASEVTFTVGAKADYGSEGSSKAGQLDFTSISVDPWTGVAPGKVLVSIAIKDQKVNYNLNDAFDKGTVTATFDDASEADVTSDAEFSGYNLAVAGDYTVKVQYTYSGVTKETSYTIKVVDPSVTQYFTKVTTTPASWVGTYLLVCEDKGVALTGSKTEAGDIKKPTAVVISDNKILVDENTRAIAITIEENTNSGYLLKTASEYYFYNTSNTKNGFAVSQSANTADDYVVTLGISDQNAVITAAGSILRYNAGSSIFQFYKPESADAQTAVQLYKL